MTETSTCSTRPGIALSSKIHFDLHGIPGSTEDVPMTGIDVKIKKEYNKILYSITKNKWFTMTEEMRVYLQNIYETRGELVFRNLEIKTVLPS